MCDYDRPASQYAPGDSRAVPPDPRAEEARERGTWPGFRVLVQAVQRAAQPAAQAAAQADDPVGAQTGGVDQRGQGVEAGLARGGGEGGAPHRGLVSSEAQAAQKRRLPSQSEGSQPGGAP